MLYQLCYRFREDLFHGDRVSKSRIYITNKLTQMHFEQINLLDKFLK